MKHIAIFGIIVIIAGLIYGIVNKANDIVFMCLIFLFISFPVLVFDKNELTLKYSKTLIQPFNKL